MGDKTIWGPILGIINQVLWIAFVFLTKQWGLLLGVLLYTGVHARNLYFWLKQNKLKEAIS
jgi:nicotinamide riboside transporter PnuC